MVAYLAPGIVIRGYRILEMGRGGGEGMVYKAAAPTRRTVAVKQLSHSIRDPEFRDVWERTLRLKYFIGKPHANVMDTLEIFEQDDTGYVVTEWVEGITVQDWLEEKGALSVVQTLDLLQQLFVALMFLNGHEFVHRDIKPDNIILAKGMDGRLAVKVIDLGIALPLRLPRLTVKGVLGTPMYTSPEAFSGGALPIGPSSDLYSVGVTAWEAVTGRYPFPFSSWEELFTRMLAPERPRICDHVPDVPADVEHFILRLFQPDPKDRFASPEQALEALEALPSSSAYGLTPVPKTIVKTPTPGAPSEEPAMPVPVSLTICSGPYAGTCIAIPEKGVCIGRGAVNPEDELIGRFHALVKPVRGTLRVRDLGSRNGLIFAHKRRRRAVLRPGDELRLGATLLAYSTTKGGDS